MTSLDSVIDGRGSRVWRSSRAVLWSGLALLALSWFLANWSPIRPVSIGPRLLCMGALPWLLQWAALALFLSVYCRRRLGLGRGAVITVAAIPLAVGGAFWIGLALAHWSDDPVGFILNVLMERIAWEYGGESFSQGVLHGVLGPLTCPLLLRGPYAMTGWNFLWAGLSTALVMWLWAWTEAFTSQKKQARSQTDLFVTLGAVGLIYISPVCIRAIMRIVHAASSFGTEHPLP